jgi:isopenicillin N synthase-like dioxygenase
MNTTAQAIPPFPDDVPTAPLLRISLEKLLRRDTTELEHFVRACEDLGFFYLDLTGPGDALLADADKLFGVGEELFDLPLDEKNKYDFSSQKSYFGYKAQGAAVVDRKGNIDRNEFYNVSLATFRKP